MKKKEARPTSVSCSDTFGLFIKGILIALSSSCGKHVAFAFEEKSYLPAGYSRLIVVVEVAANASHEKEGSKANECILFRHEQHRQHSLLPDFCIVVDRDSGKHVALKSKMLWRRDCL